MSIVNGVPWCEYTYYAMHKQAIRHHQLKKASISLQHTDKAIGIAEALLM